MSRFVISLCVIQLVIMICTRYILMEPPCILYYMHINKTQNIMTINTENTGTITHEITF